MCDQEANDSRAILRLWDTRSKKLGYRNFLSLCRQKETGLSERTVQRWSRGGLSMITFKSLMKIEIIFQSLEADKKLQLP